MKNNKILITISLLTHLFILTGITYATTPVVSNVTGTVQTGQTLTITGTNLMNDNSANWIKNDNGLGVPISDTVVNQDYFIGAPAGSWMQDTNGISLFDGWKDTRYYEPGNPVNFDNTTYLFSNSGLSVKNTTNTSCIIAGCGAANIYASPITKPSNFYVSAYLMFNGTWASVYQKLFNIMGGTGEVYVQPNCNGDGTVTGIYFKCSGQVTDHNGVTTAPVPSSTSMSWDQNVWHYAEFLIDTTSYSGDQYTLWWDGVQVAQVLFGSHSGVSPDTLELGIPNWAGFNGQNGNPYIPTVPPFTVWVSRYVISTSRIGEASRVEVGNSPTYNANSVVWQRPVRLSDTSSQVTLDLTGLGSGPYYLWVTNNQQGRSGSYLLGSSSSPTLSPVSNFSSTLLSGTVPLSVSFTDTSTNSPTAWSWTFGDGGTSTSQNPTHQYTSAGTYSVSLTATNSAGSNTKTQSNYITVSAAAATPVSNFSSTPLSGTVPLSVSFTDTSTNSPTAWSWTFGDGGTSTSQNPTHQYTSAGTYSVSLTATNSAGSNTKTQSNYITVSAAAATPAASFSSTPLSGTVPLSVSFTDTSTNSPTAWSWTFGDGGTSTSQNPTHQYTSAGTYSVSLTATNSAGSNTMTQSNYITVTASTATNLLSESFDDASFSSRGWYDSPNMLVDTSTKHSGAASLKWHWAKGATQPDNGATMRHPITATDKLYVSYWTAHSSSWVGSGETYHPHMIMLLTDQDTAYSGLAWTHLSFYIEENQQTPRLIIGDGANVNYSNGTPPDNLVGITENRSVGGCNGDLGATGDSGGPSCYQSGGSWYNGRTFTSPTQYFSDTCPGPYCKTDWHHVEVYGQMNSISGGVAQADGVMWYKYDGTKILGYNNVVFRTGQNPTQKWNQLDLCPWIGDGSPVDQTVWIDDLTLLSSDPGASGAGDTPNTPTGVQVQIIN